MSLAQQRWDLSEPPPRSKSAYRSRDNWADPDSFGVMLRHYYRNASVRRRMHEFLGLTRTNPATAAYIVGNNGWSGYYGPSPPSALWRYLEARMDVERSLWDFDSLIFDFDLEYHNFDSPAVPWLDPERAFALQLPLVNATLHVLNAAGIEPLILVSGRGFHLLWSVAQSSPAFHALASLGQVPPTLEAQYAHPIPPAGTGIDPLLARAYAGAGLLAEYIGHRVLALASPLSSIPVQLTAIEVGPSPYGREILSFDISEYGDPLHTRHIRIPFSVYLKPRHFEWALGDARIRQILPIFEIPLAGMALREALRAARNPGAAAELARHPSARIPDHSTATSHLLATYTASPLAGFHRRFAAGPWDDSPFPPGVHPPPIPGVPPCVNWLLDHPNDWMLRPAALQHVTRVLTALDWSPQRIVHLIHACYQRDCNFGCDWRRLDPFNRAMFYTRLFAGMIAGGADTFVDMNCVSHREKGYCMDPECRENLATYRDLLVERTLT